MCWFTKNGKSAGDLSNLFVISNLARATITAKIDCASTIFFAPKVSE
jgi:hypothetical protein